MDRKTQVTIATVLGLAIAGCTIGETPETTNTTTPAPTATPTQTSSSATPPAPNAGTPSSNSPTAKNASQVIPPFGNPIVPEAGNSALNTSTVPVVSLTQPTNATERADMVIKGRRDPFVLITAPITSVTPPTQNGSRTTRQAIVVPPPLRVGVKQPNKNQPNKNQTNKNQPNKNQPNKNQITKQPTKNTQPPVRKVTPGILPPVTPNTTIVSVLPQPQQPKEAQEVVVTGVIMFGKETKAIIKAPNEPTSRSVQPGQRLANGVLVKRIEMNKGNEPVVVLEQNGIEVVKSVEKQKEESKTNRTASQPTGNSVSVAGRF
ncbi:MAG TPA: hypothetical protein VK184_20125 [Nostocaceae cyanobacterium]|nr:hypothetical protein [Nostocaceae cyanobacterium]